MRGRAARRLTPGAYTTALSSPPYPLLGKRYMGQLDERSWRTWMMEVLGSVYDALAPDSTLVLNLESRYLRGAPHHSLYRERLYLALADHTGFVPAQQFIFLGEYTADECVLLWVSV